MGDLVTRLPVRDWLFLVAHSDSGKPRTHPVNLAIGLAAATLTDLALREMVTTETPQMLGLRGRPPTGDPIGDLVLDQLRRAAGARQLVDVLRWLAGDITGRAGAGLHAAGLVRMSVSKRVFASPVITYRPVSDRPAQWIIAAVTAAFQGSQYSDPRQWALAGLLGVLRLEGLLGQNIAASEQLRRLDEVLRFCASPVVDIVTAADRLISEQAIAPVH